MFRQLSPIDFEKELRAKVFAVENQKTYFDAVDMINSSTVDNINSVGPTSNKAALNFATEKIIRYVLQAKKEKKQIDLTVVRYILSIIDLLLSKGADLSALKHRETKELIDIFNTVSDKIAVRCFAEKPSITQQDLTLLIIRFGLEEQQYIAQQIKSISERIQDLALPSNEQKALIICETHDDLGSTKFLSSLQDELIAADYINLCLEYCADLDKEEYKKTDPKKTSISKNFKPLSQFAAQAEFKPNVSVIDLIRTLEDLAPEKAKQMHIQEAGALELLGPLYFNYVREKGMGLKIEEAVKSKPGNFICVVGARHGQSIIEKFNSLGIATIVVAPFDDANEMRLMQNDHGKYRPTPDCEYTVLFEKYGCIPVKTSDAFFSITIKSFAEQLLTVKDKHSLSDLNANFAKATLKNN